MTCSDQWPTAGAPGGNDGSVLSRRVSRDQDIRLLVSSTRQQIGIESIAARVMTATGGVSRPRLRPGFS